MEQLLKRLDRTEVGKQPELLADPQQPFFRPHMTWQLIPFRASDSSKENGIGFFAA